MYASRKEEGRKEGKERKEKERKKVKKRREKKEGKPLRAIIPYGTETNIQLSLGKSHLSLKLKASDSKQL